MNLRWNTLRNGMFGLGMASKEILSHLFNPFNLKIFDLKPGNVVMVATGICGKSPSRRSGYMGLRENTLFLTLSVFLLLLSYCYFY